MEHGWRSAARCRRDGPKQAPAWSDASAACAPRNPGSSRALNRNPEGWPEQLALLLRRRQEVHFDQGEEGLAGFPESVVVLLPEAHQASEVYRRDVLGRGTDFPLGVGGEEFKELTERLFRRRTTT